VLNIGAGEMILIALVLLMAVGPEQLPGLIRRAGRTVSEIKSMTEGLRTEFMSGLDEIERATDPEAWAAGNDTAASASRNRPARLGIADSPNGAEPEDTDPDDYGVDDSESQASDLEDGDFEDGDFEDGDLEALGFADSGKTEPEDAAEQDAPAPAFPEADVDPGAQA